MEENRVLTILRENWNFKVLGIEFLRDGGGRTYVVTGEEQKFLLKIVGSAFRDTVRQSVDVMRYLARNAFPVPAVMETNLQQPMLEISDEGQTYLFVLYEYIEGTEPDLCVCAEKVGILIGRLHKLLLNYSQELVRRGASFFIGRYIDILRKKGYPRADAYARLGAAFWKRVENCPVSICHGDLHRGNLLETADGEIYLLDFDTICAAPRMFDVMVMCDMTNYFDLQSDDIKTTQKIFEAFAAGYTRYMELTAEERATFKDWVVIRHFQLQATIVEIYGLDCINNDFIDKQLEWIENWIEQLGTMRNV